MLPTHSSPLLFLFAMFAHRVVLVRDLQLSRACYVTTKKNKKKRDVVEQHLFSFYPAMSVCAIAITCMDSIAYILAKKKEGYLKEFLKFFHPLLASCGSML